MSQELMGTCGAAVGSSEYFHLLNQGKIFAPFMAQDGYQYSSAIGQLSSRCSAIIDEIYYDLQNIYGNIARLSPEHKDNLIKLITNLEVAASFMLPAYTSANSCIQLLSREESGEDESIMGIWGMDIGSYSYMQSKCSGIFSSAFADPLASISQAITADLTTIAEQIASDVETGISQNYYIKDENGDALQAAISELERCNCSILALSSLKVEKLCWFSNLSNADIVALQKALNKIPGFDKLTEDGIYGEKTSNIYDKLISSLIHGTFPSVAFINPLQSHSTGVWANAKITKAGESFTQLFMDGTSWPIFRADKHNYKGIPDFPHINVEAVRGAPDWQKAIVDSLDHRELSKGTYDILKNFDNTAKIIKAGSRVLLVAGVVVDAIELGSALQSDLNDADQKLGKTTARASISIIGSWGGGALGAKAGAYVGAGIGTAILPGVGTLVGGVVGGLILGVAGSAAGSALGEWVVDITDIWE